MIDGETAISAINFGNFCSNRLSYKGLGPLPDPQEGRRLALLRRADRAVLCRAEPEQEVAAALDQLRRSQDQLCQDDFEKSNLLISRYSFYLLQRHHWEFGKVSL